MGSETRANQLRHRRLEPGLCHEPGDSGGGVAGGVGRGQNWGGAQMHPGDSGLSSPRAQLSTALAKHSSVSAFAYLAFSGAKLLVLRAIR